MGYVTPLGDPAQHFWLTRSMARALGLSLSEAMNEGHLSADEYARMVTRCRQCTFVQQCQMWLAHNGAGAEAAPGECMHKDLLDGLKQERAQ